MAVRDDLMAAGRGDRTTVRRSEHAGLDLPERDPVAVLEQQNTTRLADLVPVRMGRMLQSPFTFYRGSAAVMAHDLTTAKVTGTTVVCCGDAHVSNFGLFASPERTLLFDLNDFDEAAIAPWEWDLKRLTTSVVLAARDRGLTEDAAQQAVLRAAHGYRTTLAQLMDLTALERFYFRVSADDVTDAAGAVAGRRVVTKAATKAAQRTSEQLLDKITVMERGGVRHITTAPPVLVPLTEPGQRDLAQEALRRYRSTAREDVIVLLEKFTFTDVALRVVGVGSVGTRCFIALLVGPADEPLFVQAKQALPSTLETHGRVRQPPVPGTSADAAPCQGRRVVAYQRVLQAHSDPLLGWVTGLRMRDGVTTDFYFRQFRDMKGGLDLARLTAEQLTAYGVLCARLLARAHSQSLGAFRITGYLADSGRFDEAIGRWSVAYADVVEQDFERLERATACGRVPVERGV